MSSQDVVADDELLPSQTKGYNPGEKKTLEEYAKLDAEDESLARWKASLGLVGNSAGNPNAPKLTLHSISLESPTAPNGAVSIQIESLNDQQLEQLRKNPITVKEGVTYNVSIRFSVGSDVLSGLKYLHVVKRAGITVDKLEEMIGSYGPRPEAYVKRFAAEEAPSGMLARSGTNVVRSRVVDDDNNVYADWTWAFKLGKDWA